MKKIIASLQAALTIVLWAPTKQLPTLMRRGGGLEPYSMCLVSLLVSAIILLSTTSVAFQFENIDPFSTHSFLMLLIVSAWWNIAGVAFYILREAKTFHWYLGYVEMHLADYRAGREVPAEFIPDLKRIS